MSPLCQQESCAKLKIFAKPNRISAYTETAVTNEIGLCYHSPMNAQPHPVHQPIPWSPSYAPVIEWRRCAWVCIGYKRIERQAA